MVIIQFLILPVLYELHNILILHVLHTQCQLYDYKLSKRFTRYLRLAFNITERMIL